MSESFLKALKWYILMVCAIIGTSAFIIADNSKSVRPVLIGIICYGVVYLMSYFWKELRGKLLLYSIIIFLTLSFASAKVPIFLYILFGFPITLFDPHYTWAGTVGILGVPIMTYVFNKYD